MKERELVRFGVSMPQDLIEQFDSFIADRGYNNRSEAIRDLVRKVLIQMDYLAPNALVAGTIVIVYDHHASGLPSHLMELQHAYYGDIISTMHVHLSHHKCMEIIVVNGEYGRLSSFTDAIRVQKGVFYAELSVSVIDTRHDTAGSRLHEHHEKVSSKRKEVL
ncbi:nickel-responsive transcriptional regulator NikR [Cohnella kolymensis]|uniref:nickel-responsive transcriptional regulator NikR n=1 Tax=Cohnella kolymensis TaxID=1590652 RepID=UPI000A410C55|nr:nickel-responsive transcriptional regulator NikR [Cohnella kolymensis]